MLGEVSRFGVMGVALPVEGGVGIVGMFAVGGVGRGCLGLLLELLVCVCWMWARLRVVLLRDSAAIAGGGGLAVGGDARASAVDGAH